MVAEQPCEANGGAASDLHEFDLAVNPASCASYHNTRDSPYTFITKYDILQNVLVNNNEFFKKLIAFSIITLMTIEMERCDWLGASLYPAIVTAR